MKRLLLTVAFLFMALVATFAQNDKLSYQAVVRNSANELVANENITVVISILNGTTADAPVAYSEQHAVTTNQNGLMSLLIGDGTNQTGSFADVQWDNASVKSEITLPDGNVTSIVPMTAVPYALYAANANAGITAKDLENFIDTVTMPTALSVYGHVNSMDNGIKTGLKTWVAQVVKNNPTYAVDVLTYYIENLTSAQVTEIFGAYGDMAAQPKADLLNGLAQIIKDNPDIAYDVLNYYIDNVDVQRALSVLPHINSMDNGVKTGLKTWVAQVAKNNPTYVYDVLDYYLGNTTASTSVGEAITNYAANHKDVAKAIVANYLQNGTAQDVDDMVNALLQNQAGGRAQFQNYLNAYIDSRLGTETSQKFTATDGQTNFTLTNAPKSNYLVRMYINGVMVGDSATGVVTVNGTTVTYVPAQNGNKALEDGDTIILSYFK